MAQKIRGVNLGGWLVLEKWLTPSMFADTNARDEYTFMQNPEAAKRIEKHRRTFITEEDFEWMSQQGINLIRIPVGYWLFEPINGFTPTVKYLDNAIQWAEKYHLQVLIDFHAARGSQNGFDNSGREGTVGWYTDQYHKETIEILCEIAKRYKKSPALWGIELLNEPLSKKHYWSLVSFYRKAYKYLYAILPAGTHIVFHDSFRPLLFAGSLWQRKAHPVMMDVHWYASPLKTSNLKKYLSWSARIHKLLLFILQLWQPVIVGEWSTVMPQRFFDAVPLDRHMDLLRQNAQVQQTIYEHSAGWIYWNYKAEGGGMWNFRDLVERGVIIVGDQN